jgi:deoxycytidine triphosphate deaminase
MFRSGPFVAAHVTPVDPAQVQPNGVDLTLDAVFEQVEPGRVERDGKHVGDRREREPDGDRYRLDPGGYVARYAETVHVPGGHVGFLYPRSTLLRNSCMLNTAVWDAGYEGRGEGLLQVHHAVEIEPGARVAQFVLATAAHEGTYDGSYQGENVPERD